MALLALGHVYSIDILCDAPFMKEAHRAGDGEILLIFENASTGLVFHGTEINALRIFNGSEAMSQGSDFWIRIEGDELRISFLKAYRNALLYIAFAWEAYYEVNVFNKSGIPVRPFQVYFNGENI